MSTNTEFQEQQTHVVILKAQIKPLAIARQKHMINTHGVLSALREKIRGKRPVLTDGGQRRYLLCIMLYTETH